MADRRSKIIADAFVDFTNPDWEEDGDSEEPYHHQIVTSYEHILHWLYEELLEQFWVPGKDVPEVSPLLSKLFKDPKVKHANLSDHSFRVFLGLFRALNVANSSNLRHPLPPIARIVPLVVAYWNALKGGGDTITKLLDDCQERIGKRTDVTVTCARLLLQLGIHCHRLFQIVTNTKPAEEFDTLNHFRNAASKRFTFKKSLETVQDKLLQNANTAVKKAFGLGRIYDEAVERSDEEDTEDEDESAPEVGMKGRRKSSRKATPVMEMTSVADGGLTPGKGCSIDNPSDEFKRRCDDCLGFFPSNKYKKGVAERRRCHFCQRKGTTFYCYSCRRPLCNEPPLNGVDRKGNKYPRFFSIPVPKTGTRGNATTVEERGDLTCFILAHKRRWDEYRENDVDTDDEDEDGTGKKKTPKDGKRKKQKTDNRVALCLARRLHNVKRPLRGTRGGLPDELLTIYIIIRRIHIQ